MGALGAASMQRAVALLLSQLCQAAGLGVYASIQLALLVVAAVPPVFSGPVSTML